MAYIGKIPAAAALTATDITDGIISNAKLAQDIISADTAEASIATDDVVLIHDTSAGALRKMTRANFVSGVGGDNTPAFMAYINANQSISNASWSKVNLNTELFDTDSSFDSSTNYKWVVPEDGKYLMGIGGQMAYLDDTESLRMIINKNGSLDYDLYERKFSPTSDEHVSARSCAIMSLAEDDELELYCYHNEGASQNLKGANLGANGEAAYMFGFKIIGA